MPSSATAQRDPAMVLSSARNIFGDPVPTLRSTSSCDGHAARTPQRVPSSLAHIRLLLRGLSVTLTTSLCARCTYQCSHCRNQLAPAVLCQTCCRCLQLHSYW